MRFMYNPECSCVVDVDVRLDSRGEAFAFLHFRSDPLNRPRSKFMVLD